MCANALTLHFRLHLISLVFLVLSTTVASLCSTYSSICVTSIRVSLCVISTEERVINGKGFGNQIHVVNFAPTVTCP